MKFQIEQENMLKTADGKEFPLGSGISFLYPNMESDRVLSYRGTIVMLSGNHMVINSMRDADRDMLDHSADEPGTIIYLEQIIEGSCQSITA